MEACDQGYQDKIARAAEQICANLKKSPVVLLSGPSGSGKTTTAEKLSRELERRGVRTHPVSMDDYFVTQDPAVLPRTPDGAIDYESPEMMDLKLLDQHFEKLTRGEWILVPRFEFARQMRNDSRGTPLKLGTRCPFSRASTRSTPSSPAATRTPPGCTSPPGATLWTSRTMWCSSAPGCVSPGERCGTTIFEAPT